MKSTENENKMKIFSHKKQTNNKKNSTNDFQSDFFYPYIGP